MIFSRIASRHRALLGAGVPATPEWDTQSRRLRTRWQQAMT